MTILFFYQFVHFSPVMIFRWENIKCYRELSGGWSDDWTDFKEKRGVGWSYRWWLLRMRILKKRADIQQKIS